MFRYLSLLLMLILSLGNVLRLGKLQQTDMLFWISFSVLLVSAMAVLVATVKFIRPMQKEKQIRLSDLKKDDGFGN